MNITTLTQTGLSARIFAGITMLSLLLSAFPVAFFVAEAATQNVTIDVSMVPNPTAGNDTITLTNNEAYDVTLEQLEINDLAVSAMYGPLDLTISANSSEILEVSNRLNQAADDVTFSGTNVTTETISYSGTPADDAVVLGDLAVAADDGTGAGLVQNNDTGETFATIQAAIDDADTDDGDVIELTADIATTAQVTIDKEITLDGGGFTISAGFADSGTSNNSVIGVIDTDNVTIENVVLDVTAGTSLHGINLYESDDVVIDAVEIINANNSGIVVNGSVATVSDLTTTGSVWNAINVALGGGVTTPSVLNVENTSSHDEVAHIFLDDISQAVTVNDIDAQYEITYEGLHPNPQFQTTARVYTLKVEEPAKVGICHFHKNGFNDIEVSVNSIVNAHGNDTEDIIPVIPGIYPTGQNLDTDYNGSTGVEVLAAGCVVPEPEPEVAPEVCSYEGTGTFSATALTNGGDPVNPARRDIAALEAGVAPYANFFGKEGNDWNVNPLDFFSLGINGEVVYEFTDKIAIDQPGADIAIWEITGGNPSEQADEKADVYGSEDGIAYVLLGQVTGDGTVDIAGSGLTFVKFVKLVDQSNGVQGNNGDGFDLDAITIIEGSCDDYATVHTTKIVCTDEADLPNWGKGGANITETTAADWMADNEESSCEIVEGWEFEWAPKKGTSNPGDALVGPAGGVWTTFSGSTMVPLSLVGGKSFWMREVLQADYTPFAGGKKNDVSAEMYCHKDVLNYDNLDRVDNPAAGGEYYCVAWNHIPAPAEQCHLPYLVTFTDESDDDTYSTTAGTGLVIEEVNDGYTIGLYDDGRSGIYRVAGTILFPVGTDVGTYAFTEASGLNGLEQTHLLYPDVADLAGNVIEFDLFVNGADDVFTITDESLVSEANCDVPTPEPEPEYGPYCGDGEVNQWEMCEVGDEGCTDYCTWDNQCTDLQLMKITLDDTESVSFDGSLHLGAADNLIPNGTWFNFSEAGDASMQSIANAVEGLAIERNQTDGTLGLAFVGGNGRKKLDIVAGSIMTLGIDLGTVDRAPNPSFKLEDGSGNSFDDVFDKSGENITFDLRADTGNDGVTVEINEGEEYNCPDCLAGVEARIMDVTYGEAGDGQVNDDVLLGDGTRVAYGEWFPLTSDSIGTFITDADNATNFPDEDESGLYVSRNGDGTMNVVLVGDHNPGGNTNHEWISGTVEVRDASIAAAAALPGDFKFESHNNGSVPSNDGFDVLGTPTASAVDFKMWVDTASDGFKVTVDAESIVFCEDDTIDREPEPDMFTISGVKYEVEGEVETPAAGWTIYAYNGVDTPLSTTTDENGYYYFDVLAGNWEVYEEDRADWELVDIFQYPKMYYLPVRAIQLDEELDEEPEMMTSCFFSLGFEQESPFALRSAQFLTVETDEEWFEFDEVYNCDFYNEYTEPVEEDDEEETSSGSSSSGTRTNRLSDAGPAPLVLGASTDQCPFLVDYMQISVDNDPMEVMKLQLFLNIFKGLFGGSEQPVTGVFDATTDANVKLFQETYRSEILDPWYNLGIVPHNRPTGFVYKTTLWKINDIVCPDTAILPDFAGENLQSNVNID